MRRSLTIPILALLVLLALAAIVGGGSASAAGDEPTILLDSISVPETIDEPAFNEPVVPRSVHLAYGYVRPQIIPDTYTHVIFDENEIAPSAEPQTFYAYTDQDSDAEALAADLNKSLPQYTFLGVIFWFEHQSGDSHSSEAFSNPDLRFHVHLDAHIDYFKMTVAPFTIEKRIVDPFHRAEAPEGARAIQPQVTIAPYSVYRMITEGPVATVEVFGPPPPGDANCDAAVSSLDALVMLQHGAGLLDALSCAKAAEVTHDGTVDARDAQLVLQFTAELLEEL